VGNADYKHPKTKSVVSDLASVLIMHAIVYLVPFLPSHYSMLNCITNAGNVS